MRSWHFFTLLLAINPYLYGSDQDSTSTANTSVTDHVFELEKMVVTATRYPANVFSIARSVTVVDKKELANKNQFSVLDALDDEIGIWIEKRTSTASDPVVRGLSGANILALVDGNSLTTFWGEGGFAGDDMYGKIDGESIGLVEVVRGPSSVIYGSNALGGVINFMTKKAQLPFSNKGFSCSGKIKGASGSASDYRMARFESWGASPILRYFFGATTHRSGDMKVGGHGGNIVPSGGKDWSIDLNSEIKLDKKNFLEFSSQYMNRPQIYRSYRPDQCNSNIRYGINLGYHAMTPSFISDLLRINLYHQYKYDARTWYKNENRKEIKTEGFAWWRTVGADFQSNKQLFYGNMLITGLSYHLDLAESPDDEQFTVKTANGNQKAAPDTKWHNAGIFIQDEWNIKKIVTLTGSIRYDYFHLIAKNNIFYTKPGDPDKIKNISMSDPGDYISNAFTGGLGAVFHVGNYTNIASSWTRGFRMTPPSFGFRQTAQGVLIPNGFLDPMTADQFEISPRLKTNIVTASLTGYYTFFHNFQQPIHGEYQGETVIDYNNNGTFEPDERVYVNAANGDAYVSGVEFEMDLHIGSITQIFNGFHFIGGLMYNYGKMRFPGQKELPLRQTHPLRALAKLRYNELSFQSRWWCELVVDIVDRYTAIARDRLLSDVGYLKNPQDPNSGLLCNYGLPSYYVFDIRGGVRFYKNVVVTVGVENLFDKRYRAAHSRMDASGRNIQLGLEIGLPLVAR